MNTDKTTQEIASSLKAIRRKMGLTQADVAEKAGLSTNFYARIERSEQQPTIETLEKLTRALGVKSSEILPF